MSTLFDFITINIIIQQSIIIIGIIIMLLAAAIVENFNKENAMIGTRKIADALQRRGVC